MGEAEQRMDPRLATELVEVLAVYLPDLESGNPSQRTVHRLSVLFGQIANLEPGSEGAAWCWALLDCLEKGQWEVAAARLRELIGKITEKSGIRVSLSPEAIYGRWLGRLLLGRYRGGRV